MSTVILASGGLDSFLCWALYPKGHANVFVHVGQKYADKELAEAVALVQPFCPDPKNPIIVLDANLVRTLDGLHSASVRGFKGNAFGHCAFRAEPLLAVLAVAERATWGSFPRVHWRGPELDGVIVGVSI